MSGEYGADQEEGFRIDDPVVIRLGITSHPDGGPLAPEEIKGKLGELIAGIFERVSHDLGIERLELDSGWIGGRARYQSSILRIP